MSPHCVHPAPQDRSQKFGPGVAEAQSLLEIDPEYDAEAPHADGMKEASA
jgi:hypothetical protein